jgi:hypothetical protein
VEVWARRGKRLVHSWPLPAEPVSLGVAGGVAVFAAADRGGLYAVRLSDGRAGFVGVTRDGDVPQIDSRGVVYQDDLFRHSPHHSRASTLLKFVPIAGVRRAIEVAGTPITTPGLIRAMAMDGPRVALAIADPRGVCDQVRFWNVEWNFSSRLTQKSGPTCTGRHAPGGITDVRIAGVRAEWVTTYGNRSTVLAASIIRCQEWVLARPKPGPGGDTLTGLAGDGPTLAFAITRHERELRGTAEVAALRGNSEARTHTIVGGRLLPRALAADSRRIAILQGDSTAEIRDSSGFLVSHFSVGDARTVALHSNRLVALGSNTVSVYNATTGELLRYWRVSKGLRPRIDMQFGIAALTRGNAVYALDLQSGRLAALAHAPGAVLNAQIEDPGIAYAYNHNGRGHVRFIRFSSIETALR